jgi:sigma-B regulation protein RsbU (phosphoserine phosphatase)
MPVNTAVLPGDEINRKNESVAKLRDYLDDHTLRRIQNAFSAVAGRAVSICGADGDPLLAVERDPAKWQSSLEGPPAAARKLRPAKSVPANPIGEMQAPILLDDEVVGFLLLVPESPGKTPRSDRPKAIALQNLLLLMAKVLTRLCLDNIELHRRVEQLTALQQVMSEITGVQELEDVLDAVIRTTVEVMKAKAGSIRLLSGDGSELVVHSVHSARPQYLDQKPIPLSESPLDQEVLNGREPVYVADMTKDPRVIYGEEAKREGLVAGLCAPIVFRKERQGVLRVFMGERHPFDWFERQLFQTIADSAAAAIANARLYAEAAQSWEIKRQIATAGVVQKRMIPRKPPKLEGFDLHARYIPSQELAGDFYDFIHLAEGNLGIAICDVVGKGVRASLLMASIRASLRAHAMNVYQISDVLNRVNRDLCADTLSSDFATLFYGILNTKTREFTYACAGHMPPILIRHGEVCHLEAQGGLLGIMPGMEYPHDTIRLEPGDVVLAYTDGISEALNFHNEPYGRERIEKALLSAVEEGYSAEAIVAYCLWDLRRFAGLHRRDDDRTLIAVKAL